MRLTNRHLEIKFEEFNRKYFKNKLKETTVKFEKFSKRLMGVTRMKPVSRPTTAKERKENNLSKKSWAYYSIPTIHISDYLRSEPRTAMITLLHEMAHAKDRCAHKCGPNRNNSHNREMLRLAKTGAFNGWW